MRTLFVFVSMLMACAQPALAQSYPSRPVRIVVGFAPGGAPDVVARLVADSLGARLGQPVIIDNRGGANGIIGADIVSKSQPDVHTLLVTSASFAINPSITRKLPFDPVKDFTPVSLLATGGGLFLVVNPTLPVKSLADLVAYAKRPGVKLAYGSAGQGNTTHLAAALLNLRAGLDLVHAPYKSAGLSGAALMGNEIQLLFVTLSSSLQHIKSGRMRVIGYNHPTRSAQLPEVPTMEEAGVAGTVIDGSWYGMFAPARLPAAVSARLASDARASVNEPAIKDKLATMGLDPDGRSGAELRRFLEASIKRFADAVHVAGIEPK